MSPTDTDIENMCATVYFLLFFVHWRPMQALQILMFRSDAETRLSFGGVKWRKRRERDFKAPVISAFIFSKIGA